MSPKKQAEKIICGCVFCSGKLCHVCKSSQDLGQYSLHTELGIKDSGGVVVVLCKDCYHAFLRQLTNKKTIEDNGNVK